MTCPRGHHWLRAGDLRSTDGMGSGSEGHCSRKNAKEAMLGCSITPSEGDRSLGKLGKTWKWKIGRSLIEGGESVCAHYGTLFDPENGAMGANTAFFGEFFYGISRC